MLFRSSYQDVVLLPPLGKVDLVFDVVAVADVDEGEILQHQSHVGDHRRTAKMICMQVAVGYPAITLGLDTHLDLLSASL